MLYISARLRMHTCSAYKPRPNVFVDLYVSYNYLHSKILHELAVIRRRYL